MVLTPPPCRLYSRIEISPVLRVHKQQNACWFPTFCRFFVFSAWNFQKSGFFLEGHIPPINLYMNLKNCPKCIHTARAFHRQVKLWNWPTNFRDTKKIEIQKIFMVIGMIIFYLSYFLKLFCKIFGYFDEFDVFL